MRIKKIINKNNKLIGYEVFKNNKLYKFADLNSISRFKKYKNKCQNMLNDLKRFKDNDNFKLRIQQLEEASEYYTFVLEKIKE